MPVLRNKPIAIVSLTMLTIILAIIGSSIGTHSAAAAGGPSVTIDSPLPLPVRETPHEPFSATCLVVGTTCTFMVPADKRLIIESISGDANMAVGFKLLIRVRGSPAAGQAPNSLSNGFSLIAPVTFQFSNGTFDFYGLNERTFLQVAAGGSISVTLVGGGNFSQATVNLSGSLVPAP